MRINDVEMLLRSAYIDWSRFIGNSRGIRRGSVITWTDRVPRMLDHPVKVSDVISLADEGQYTFQLVSDGSLIQMYYSFDRRGVELGSARLAFYSAVVDDKLINVYRTSAERSISVDAVSDAGNEFDDGSVLDEFDDFEHKTQFVSLQDGPVSWLRIEYDPQASRGVLHHDCHMHFNAFPYSRFVVAGVPTPAQFVEFIMAFCYPELYKRHRLDDQGQYTNAAKIDTVNSTCFPIVDSIAFSQMTHFRIPVNLGNRRR